MTTLSKILLTIATTGLAGGSVVAFYGDNASPVALAVVLPLGAVAFGMFLIVFMLEKEVASYDQEQALKRPAPMQHRSSAKDRNQPFAANSRPT
ncbi:MAG TPA: hypothetical protein VMF08_16070 [Candidatus Sulfotelmatobacter sp.]|nr:hypothetical protein [Candidatus Sulfotelmatobacter sp.]